MNLITDDGQAQVRDLLFGEGTGFPFVDAGPDWWVKPSTIAADTPRARGDGVVPQFDRLDAATLTPRVLVAADTPELWQARHDELSAAWRTENQTVELAFRWAGRTEFRRGRTRNLAVPSGWVGAANTAVAVLQFVATDPRRYSAVLKSDSTGVGETTGGLAFPHGFPHGFGFASPGVIAVENAGSALAPWVATLTGPLSSPRISLVGGGGVLELAGFSLADGQQLVLDSAERSVILNGSASRYGALTQREWFDLPAGSSSVQLNASSGSGTLSLSWRDTWI